MNGPTRRNVLKLAGTTGLVSMVGGLAIGQEKESIVRRTGDKWRAWAVTRGVQTKLVVEGIYELGGPGLVVIVKDAVPQGINPKILLLELKTATLPGIWPAVIQAVPAYYTKVPYKKHQYESVQILYPNGNGVTIEKIIDTGNGPK